MLNALRSARPQQPYLLSYSLPNHITRRPSGIRFARTASGPKQNDYMNSKKQSDQDSKTVDSMSSFGEGYSTRSDEEGFGGIYGGKQSVCKDGEEKIVHGDDVEFDYSQGCEVKEKERARHQNKIKSRKKTKENLMQGRKAERKRMGWEPYKRIRILATPQNRIGRK